MTPAGAVAAVVTLLVPPPRPVPIVDTWEELIRIVDRDGRAVERRLWVEQLTPLVNELQLALAAVVDAHTVRGRHCPPDAQDALDEAGRVVFRLRKILAVEAYSLATRPRGAGR